MSLIENATQLPISVVGGNLFGRYPKISAEKTYNMFISDNWLVNYAGFQNVLELGINEEGRGLFHSSRGNFLIAVVGSFVFKIVANPMTGSIAATRISIGNTSGLLSTTNGEVTIDENLAQQIAIVDGDAMYIYTYAAGTYNETLTKCTLNYTPAMGPSYKITPGYVAYHNSFFLVASGPNSQNPQAWYAIQVSDIDLSTAIVSILTTNQFAIETKPDQALALKRIPGHSNHVMIFGETVCEIWSNIGGTQNYAKVQSSSADRGVVSINTIAASEDRIVWLSENEFDGACLMVYEGGQFKRISTDGIDFLLQSLVAPQTSTAFYCRLDGHLFYQITFFDERDNLSLLYDFNSGLFFNVSDESMNYHPARQVTYYNNTTYFVSLNHADLFTMATDIISYNYNVDPTIDSFQIPRVRICNTVRMPDASRFRVGRFSLTIEQGVTKTYEIDTNNGLVCLGLLVTEPGFPIITETGVLMIDESGQCFTNLGVPRVDMTFSKDGNQIFSNVVSRDMNSAGFYRNMMQWWRMGEANEFTIQLRFWGLQRFVVGSAILEIY